MSFLSLPHPGSFAAKACTSEPPFAPAQQVARETKGLPDEPRTLQELIDVCLQVHAQTQHGPLSDAQEEQVVQTIRSLVEDCLQGSKLDLQYFGESGLPGEFPAPGDVPVLPADAWHKLDGYVRSREGRGITDVEVSTLARLDCVAGGLASLADLAHVTVVVPERMPDDKRVVIDLRALQRDHPERLVINLKGDVSNLLVKVPVNTLAQASGISNPALCPSTVEYFDDKSGKPLGPPRTLGGTVYGHTPAWFDQKTGSTLNANGTARRRKGLVAFSQLPQPGEKLKCHSLCMAWAVSQQQKVLDGKAGDKSAGISQSASVQRDISASYTDQVAGEEFAMMVGASTEAIFDLDNFGAMIEDQMQQLKPDENRWFFVNSPSHTMVLELCLREQGAEGEKRPVYTAVLFEPNRTVLSDRMEAASPQTFAHTSIDSWLTPEEQQIFFPLNPKVGTLIRWTPPQEREGAANERPRVGPRLHVDPMHIGSPEFLMAAMDSHAPDAVTQSIEAIVDTKASASDRLEMLRAEDLDGRTPLIWASSRNQADNVAAYVRAIVSAPCERLSLDDKLALLRGVDPDSELPVLRELAERPSDFWPEPAIRAYVREIASSSLALHDKIGLLGDKPVTAAQCALAHAPGRVVAMTLGILDANLPMEQTHALVESMGVSGDELVSAVTGRMERLTVNPHPIAPDELRYLDLWLAMLNNAIAPKAWEAADLA